MKVCIIANGYPTNIEQQWGCFEKDQAVALKKAGHEVSILYVDGRFRNYWRRLGVTYLKDNGINIYGIYLFPLSFFSFISYKLSYKIRTFMLEYIFKYMLKNGGKPDVVYAHYLYNIANAANLKEKFGVPLVGIEHWSVLNQNQPSNKILYLGNIAYNKADKILAVSNALAKSIKRIFKKDSLVVNDLVGEEFVNESCEVPSKKSKFTFIAIGSLIKRKGFDLLIKAFYKSCLCKKKCELIIIGGGREEKGLQALIDFCCLRDSVQLVGRKNKKEIISYLQQSNAFVLSSHVETFSVVCIEAMSQGVPVIATACGGPEEFVTKDVGVLVKPSDVDDLTNAMIGMYENYHLYDNEKIAEYCRNKFAPEVIAKQLTYIFEDVVSNYKDKQ